MRGFSSSGISYSSGGVVDRYESIYAVLCRFATANTLSHQNLLSLFRSSMSTSGARSYGLESLLSVKIGLVEQLLDINKAQLYEMFLTPHHVGRNVFICPYLRYCPICASSLRHYAIFQLESLRLCPFHSLPLQIACCACGASALYLWEEPLFNDPFCCVKCHVSLAVLHGGVVYFDLNTVARSRKLVQVFHRGEESVRESGNAPMLSDASDIWRGYVVRSPCRVSMEHWLAMTALPLQGRTLIDLDWTHCNGYIQIRGPRLRAEVNAKDRYAEGAGEIVHDLQQCLKSILRNLRRRWGVKQRDFAHEVGEGIDRELQACRASAYLTLLNYWCVDDVASSTTWTFGQRRSAYTKIIVWLDEHESIDRNVSSSRKIRNWLMMHRFCGEVSELIVAIAQAADGPLNKRDSVAVDQMCKPKKSIWAVTLTGQQSATPHRVVFHHQYPSCLSSEHSRSDAVFID